MNTAMLDSATPRGGRSKATNKTVIALLAGVVTIAVAACQPKAVDRVGPAQDAIEEQILTELKVDSVATCQQPTSTEPGTTFPCEATADDGNTYEFIATIVDAHEITVALHV